MKIFTVLLAAFLLAAGGALHAQTNSARMLSGVNAQTGTSYIFVPADTTRAVTFNNASAVAATLPNGATQGFGAGTVLTVINLGTGAVTITCTSCTINGLTTLVLSVNQGADIYGGAGSPAVNYVAELGGSGGGGGGGGGSIVSCVLTPLAQVTDCGPGSGTAYASAPALREFIINSGAPWAWVSAVGTASGNTGSSRGSFLGLSGASDGTWVFLRYIAGTLSNQLLWDNTGAIGIDTFNADATVTGVTASKNGGVLVTTDVGAGLCIGGTTSGTACFTDTATSTSVTVSKQVKSPNGWDSCTPSAVNGQYALSYIVTASTAVPAACPQVGLAPRSVGGITSTDTVLYSDNNNSVEYEGSVAVAVTLPTPTALLNSGFFVILDNFTSGSSTAVTVTPTTLTVNGSATKVIQQGQMCAFKIDPNAPTTNWLAVCHDFPLLAGSGITLTRGQYGLTVSATTSAAFPLTITGGVSGAVPCFTSTTVESAGTLLATNALVVGGGAGACPGTGNGDFTYATHTLVGGASAIMDLHAMGSIELPNTCTAGGGGGITVFGAHASGNNELCYSPGGSGATYVAIAGAVGGAQSTTCTNQVFTVISSLAAPTCTSLSFFLTSDYTNATTGQTTITGLAVPLAASTNYGISCHLIYQGSAVTSALNISSTGPSTPTKVTADSIMTTTTGASAVFRSDATDGTTFGFTLGGTVIVSTAADMTADIHVGVMNGVNAGTFQLTGASSGTGTVTIRKGSFCTAQ